MAPSSRLALLCKPWLPLAHEPLKAGAYLPPGHPTLQVVEELVLIYKPQ